MTLFNPTEEAKSSIENRSVAAWLPPLVIFILTLAIFFPGLRNGFVLWDDNANFLNNPNYRGLGWHQLRWMFSSTYWGHYQPLSWLTLGFDYLIWGMNPLGYHLTSMLIHAANAAVFYFLCRRLIALSMPKVTRAFALSAGAAAAALLFAVHPLRVESVAWATERRDVVSGLLFLLTLIAYLEAATSSKKEDYQKWIGAAVGLYILSLLSKAVGMTLPVVLLVLDVYPLKRLGEGEGRWFGAAVRDVWREKVWFLVPAVGAASIALIAQAQAMKPLHEHGLLDRLAQAPYGLVFYLWKTLAPFRLSPLYELPPSFNPGDWIYVASAALVLAVTAVLFFFRRRWPAALALWIYYAAMVAPVSGVIQSGPQLVADRYSYLSCLGWAVLAGAAVAAFCQTRPMSWRTPSTLFATASLLAIVFGLADLTRQQLRVWRDSETLWRRVLAYYPESSVAHDGMGIELQKQGRFQEAVEHHRRVLQIDPSHWQFHYNLGKALAGAGKPEEATAEYREALRIFPDSPLVNYELGIHLYGQGKLDDAIGYFHKTVEKEPEYASAHYSLARAFARKGRLAEAIKEYQEALQRDGTVAVVYYDLGNAYFKRGQYKEAAEQYWRATRVNPDYAVAYFNLGNALSKIKETDKAIESYRLAIEHDPNYIEAYMNLGDALESRGKIKEALAQYERVVEINPRDAIGHYNLGNGLLRAKDYAAAARHYRQAIEIDPKYVEARTNLGSLLEREGKIEEAEMQYRKSLEVKPDDEAARFNLGLLLAGRGDDAGAVEQFRKVIARNPKDAEAHYQLAHSLAAVGNVGQAAEEFRETLRLDRSFTRARASLEQLLQARQE